MWRFKCSTGSKLDYIDNSGAKHLFAHLPQDLFSTLPRRNNQDTGVNRHGKEVAHLCQTLGLYILNGRIKGDSCGQFTCSSNIGNSVVDYTISNISPSHFSALTVKAQSPLSDHSQINLFIKGENITSRDIHKKPIHIHKLKTPYRWTRNATETYIKVLK